MATTPVPAKRGRKPAAATAQQAGGQVQSLTRGLKLLEWIAESHSSVALTELAQQAAHFATQRFAQFAVQVGERLIKQQHPRRGDDRSRQRHPLLLAAGKA